VALSHLHSLSHGEGEKKTHWHEEESGPTPFKTSQKKSSTKPEIQTESHGPFIETAFAPLPFFGCGSPSASLFSLLFKKETVSRSPSFLFLVLTVLSLLC
jgi:hypothetical protein